MPLRGTVVAARRRPSQLGQLPVAPQGDDLNSTAKKHQAQDGSPGLALRRTLGMRKMGGAVYL
jgi:hypothetical protein